MSRPKKIAEAPNFELNKYQKNIIDFILHGNGNLLIEANAGCGKTSTLIKIISLLPKDKKILFCAFNKDIVTEISKKVKGWDNVEVSSVHSLGLKMLKHYYSDKGLTIDTFKYSKYLKKNLNNLTTVMPKYMDSETYIQFTKNVLRIVDLLRFNLVSTFKTAQPLLERYDIVPLGDEVEIALKLLDWGKNNLDTIDYTDMVWLPNILFLKTYGFQYDYVFGDECQDFSTMQRELILKCRKMNTRFVFCGDENQAIYGFSSSDVDSFNKLKVLPNMSTLTLPISYRCADRIVDYAKPIVPSIEYNEQGRVGNINFNCPIGDVKDGDMILCRNNSPLTSIYSKLIKEGKKCYIRGKDIGTNLKNLVNDTEIDSLNLNLSTDGVFPRLYKGLFEMRKRIAKNNNITLNDAMKTEAFSNKLDSIKTLELLASDLKTKDELLKRIDEVFSDKTKEGIMLSTIHKAKGLENDNVFIACRSLIPSKSARLDWEKKQEQNLLYVAITRAKNNLGFLTEDGFEEYTNELSSKKMAQIERTICQIFKIKYDEPLTLEKAEEIISKSKPLNNSGKIGMNTVKGLTSIVQPVNNKKLTKFKFA